MKCKDKVEGAFESRMEDIRTLWKAEDNKTEDLGSLDEYGLSFDYISAGTFSDQKAPYWRWQLSYGGPTEEFRMYENGDMEFWYLDWFDGACVDVGGDDYDIIDNMWGEYKEYYKELDKEFTDALRLK